MAAWAPFNTTHWGMLSQPDKQKLTMKSEEQLDALNVPQL
jgi:hypothetical protein